MPTLEVVMFTFYDRPPEDDLFKRVPEGWIFTIGRKWSYIVNDAQKAELLARLARWRFVPSVLLVAIIVPPLIAIGVSDWLHFAAFTAIYAFSVFLISAVAMPYIHLFILRPVLAGAERAISAPTPTRVGSWDSLFVAYRRQAQILSSRFLTIACLFFGWLSIEAGYQAITSKGSYFDAVAMVLVTVHFGVVLFLKRMGP
jgi:hypothetical protein